MGALVSVIAAIWLTTWTMVALLVMGCVMSRALRKRMMVALFGSPAEPADRPDDFADIERVMRGGRRAGDPPAQPPLWR